MQNNTNAALRPIFKKMFPPSTVENLEVGSQFRMYVSYVELDKDLQCIKIWGQLDKPAVIQVEKTLLNWQPYLNSGKGMMNCKEIAVGKICCAMFEDQNWYRAKIVEVLASPSGVVKVLFIDYGNVEMATVQDLRKLDALLFNIPPRAHGFVLANVAPLGKNWSDNAIAFCRQKLNYVERNVKVVGQVGDYWSIVIYLDEDIAFNSLLVNVGHAIKCEGFHVLSRGDEAHSSGTPVDPPRTLKSCELAPSETYRAKIVHVEDDSSFFIRTVAHERQFEYTSMCAGFSFYCRSVDSNRSIKQDVFIGMMCFAKNALKEQFARGVIVAVTDVGGTVYFMDYGNRELLPLPEIHPMPDVFRQPPALAIRCNLGNPNVNKKELVCMLLQLSDQQVNCVAQGLISNNYYMVRLYSEAGDVLQKLLSASSNVTYKKIVMKPGVQYKVNVIHVTDPALFHVRLEQYCGIPSEIENQLRDKSQLKQLTFERIARDMACIARCSETGRLYRARIVTHVNDSRFKVFYVDTGKSEMLGLDNLYEINVDSLMNLPELAIPCALSQMSPELSVAKKATAEFLAMVHKKLLIAETTEVRNDGCFVVTLYDTSGSHPVLLNLQLQQKMLEKNVKVTVKQPLVEKRESIFITSYESSASFFGQLSKFPTEMLNQMTEGLSSYYFDLSQDEQLLCDDGKSHVGEFCCCPYAEDKQVYRAKVEDHQGSKVLVNFVDFGNMELVELCELKILPPTFATLPAFGVRCSLANTFTHVVGHFNDSVKQVLLDRVIEFDIGNESNGIYDVMIPDCEENKDVLNQLKMFSVVPRSTLPPRSELSKLNPVRSSGVKYTEVKFAVGEELGVIVSYVTTPKAFWCQRLDHADQLGELLAKLNDAVANKALTRLADVREGAPCAAEFMNSWNRAVISKTNPQSTEIFFVDYGNMMTVKSDVLLNLTPNFMALPKQAVECMLEYPEPLNCDIAFLRTFEEAVLEIVFTAKVKRKLPTSGVYCIDLFDNQGESVAMQLGLFNQTKNVNVDFSRGDETRGEACEDWKEESTPPTAAGDDGWQEKSSNGNETTWQAGPSSSSSNRNIGDGRWNAKGRNGDSNFDSGRRFDRDRSNPRYNNNSNSYREASGDNRESTHLSRDDSYGRGNGGDGRSSQRFVPPRMQNKGSEENWRKSSEGFAENKIQGEVCEDWKEESTAPQTAATDNGWQESSGNGNETTWQAGQNNDRDRRWNAKGRNGDSNFDSGRRFDRDRSNQRYNNHHNSNSFREASGDNRESTQRSRDNSYSRGNCGGDGRSSQRFVPPRMQNHQGPEENWRKTSESESCDRPWRNKTTFRSENSSSVEEVTSLATHPIMTNTEDLRSVKVVYVESPSLFYCHLRSSSPAFTEMDTQLQVHYEQSDRQGLNVFRPKIPCCAKFSGDGLWYRGAVLSCDSDDATVYFVDYGNSETTSFASLKKLEKRFAQVPEMAVKCRLHNVRSRSGGDAWTTAETGTFEGRVLDKVFGARFVSEEDQATFAVHLFEGSLADDASLNYQLIKEGFALPVDPNDGVYKEQLCRRIAVPFNQPTIVFNRREAVSISWLTTVGLLYCQLLSEAPVLTKLTTDVKEEVDGGHVERLTEWAPNVPCLAMYEEELYSAWCRAVVVDACDSEEAYVFFVDYGNVECVPKQKVVQIDERFRQVSLQAVECTLRGVKPTGGNWSSLKSAELSTYFRGETIECVFYEKHGNTFVVDLFVDGRNVAERLVEDGLLSNDDGDGVVALADSHSLLASGNGVSDTYTPFDKLPEGFYDVDVCHVENVANSFWCRLVQHSDLLLAYDQVLRDGNLEPLSADWKLGLAVVAKAPGGDDDVFYRAAITRKHCPLKFELIFVDTGESAVYQATELKLCPLKLVRHPCLAFPCLLTGWPDNQPQDDDEDAAAAAAASVASLRNDLVSVGQRLKVHVDGNVFGTHSVTLFKVEGDDVVNLNVSMGLESNVEFVVEEQQQQPEAQADAICSLGETVDQSGDTEEVVEDDAVVVSHVNSPVDFYVQKASEQDSLVDFLADLYGTYETAEPCGKKNEEEQTVTLFAAQYAEDENWYRAQVLSSGEGEEAEVLFVDYGNVATVPTDKIKRLTVEHSEIPRYATRCALHDLADITDWPIEVTNHFIDVVTAEDAELRATFVGQLGSTTLVRLTDGGGRNVSSFLNVPSSAPAAAPECVDVAAVPPVPAVSPPGFKRLDLTVGHKVEVSLSHIVSPAEFSMQRHVDCAEIAELCNRLAELYGCGSGGDDDTAGSTTGQFAVGDVCAARFSEDNLFYRGLIGERRDDGFLVHFVDFGNSEVVPAAKLRVLDASLLDVPALSAKASLRAVRLPADGVFSVAAIAQFENMVQFGDTKLLAELVEQKIDGSYVVCLLDMGIDIAAELVKSGVVEGVSLPGVHRIESVDEAIEVVRESLDESGEPLVDTSSVFPDETGKTLSIEESSQEELASISNSGSAEDPERKSSSETDGNQEGEVEEDEQKLVGQVDCVLASSFAEIPVEVTSGVVVVDTSVGASSSCVTTESGCEQHRSTIDSLSSINSNDDCRSVSAEGNEVETLLPDADVSVKCSNGECSDALHGDDLPPVCEVSESSAVCQVELDAGGANQSYVDEAVLPDSSGVTSTEKDVAMHERSCGEVQEEHGDVTEPEGFASATIDDDDEQVGNNNDDDGGGSKVPKDDNENCDIEDVDEPAWDGFDESLGSPLASDESQSANIDAAQLDLEEPKPPAADTDKAE